MFQRIFVVSMFAVFLIGAGMNTALADMGSKPEIYIHLPADFSDRIETSTLLMCEKPDCSDSKPMNQIGPQRFHCQGTDAKYPDDNEHGKNRCFGMAYGFSPYLQLQFKLKNTKVITSNIFSAGGLESNFEAIYRWGNLQVRPIATSRSTKSPVFKTEEKEYLPFLAVQNEETIQKTTSKEETEAQKYIQQLQESPYKNACTIGTRNGTVYRYYILRLPEGRSIRVGDNSAAGAVAKLKDAISKGECEPEYKKTETTPATVMQKE